MSLIEPSRKLPTRQVCERYGIHNRTLARWERDQKLNFPRALVIQKRKYYDESELTQFDRAQAARR
jgi:DNA-binding transcriptional MerR regulator